MLNVVLFNLNRVYRHKSIWKTFQAFSNWSYAISVIVLFTVKNNYYILIWVFISWLQVLIDSVITSIAEWDTMNIPLRENNKDINLPGLFRLLYSNNISWFIITTLSKFSFLGTLFIFFLLFSGYHLFVIEHTSFVFIPLFSLVNNII
jgi:putative copper export protein